MKRNVCAVILTLGIVCGIYSQSSGPMDLVVLLDTSASMSNSYRETSEYLTGPFLREFLRIGDTFHLISFAETSRLEISRRVEGVGDVEAVIGRILLMYPLELESDVSGALGFGEKYVSSLPGSRPKKLIFLSDGDAPDTQNLIDASSARLKGSGTELQYIKVPVTGSGPASGRPVPPAPVTVPKSVAPPSVAPSAVPQSGPASPPPVAVPPARPETSVTPPAPPVTVAERETAISAPPVRSETSIAPPTPPATVAESGTAVSTPPIVTPPARPETSVTPPATVAESGTTVSTPPVAASPGQQPETSVAPPAPPVTVVESEARGNDAPPASTGPGTSSVRLPQSSPDRGVTQTSPARARTDSSGSDGFFADGIPLPLLIGLILLGLLLLGFLIFFALRNLHSSPNRVIGQAAAPMDYSDRIEAERQAQQKGIALMDSYAEARKNQRKPLPRDKVYTPVNDGPVMLNLFVEDQNTAIGRRNIHTVKQGGYSFSVGGGKSDFLVFLVPIPPRIADVVFDGQNCTFIPRRPQYFPDIGSQSVSGCIGKTIRVISDKNYELHIRIERYEDPLTALNKMLNSIAVPGETAVTR